MTPTDHEPIAIIGMRGRFPGASDTDEYWKNLAQGVESITTLTHDEMRAAGIPENIFRLPGYVNAAPVLENIDHFDAQFFGFSARDASLTDPQHRLFLETAWEALEDAGYDSAKYPGRVGVFGGSELSTYLYHLYKNIESLGYIDGMQLMVTNDKDHLCTQVSYRLNLRGPSISIQTTCSTSLVAVSLACESLQHRRCDMALAGGVTVRVPQRGGYFYAAGSILSPDGHCRPFDANAQGTIVGSGVGLVVLKRLADALADRDNIRAVVLGCGLNNDGSDKVGYTAPSYRGQAEAIRAAYVSAGVSPETISYIEAHGTGTILGDPIEISALTEVFRAATKRRGFCGIGSVKSNFGHLSCAAGIAGLIKTVLAFEHNAIPPTVHYSSPNPAINMISSPFYVATQLQPWQRNGAPRRAGVSSFGVGGTNAHILIEEAPEHDQPKQKRTVQLLTISARSENALDQATQRLSAHLKAHAELDMADVAYTLHVGRRFFRHRRVIVTSNEISTDAETFPAFVAEEDRSVVFMFPGQGSQYPGMAAGLYESEDVVRQAIDKCARVLKPLIDVDLRKLLFPSQRQRKQAAEALKDTKFAQPALFSVGYSLAKLWQSWGIQPAAMIGHSVGEFVAATLAGVMTLSDALNLIAHRGKLISALPRGSMLAVMAPAEQLTCFVDDEVSLAAINAAGFSVLSGPSPAIDRAERALARESVPARRLHTSHAFHSAMMEPILPEFEDHVAKIKLSPPVIPFVTTLNGQWADGNVVQPKYWSAQLRQPVLFAEGMRTLTQAKSSIKNNRIYLETGPGNTLATFAAEAAKADGRTSLCLTSLPGAESKRSDTEVMLNSLGQLWASGLAVDWEAFHRKESRRRVSLPTYPFERQSYWIGARPDAAEAPVARDTTNWFYRPEWRESAKASGDVRQLAGRRILVFDEQTGVAATLIEQLTSLGSLPIAVTRGDAFQRLRDDAYSLDPRQADHFKELAQEVCSTGTRLAGVIDCWSAAPPAETDLDASAVVALLSPMRLAHALSNQPTVRPLPFLICARGTALVHGNDPLDPPRALSIGTARVLPQEHPGLRVTHVDIDDDPQAPALVLSELAFGLSEPVVAVRAGRRYLETFEPVAINSATHNPNLPEDPVVLITGGIGYMGLILAEGLFDETRAKLVLVGRTKLPPPADWAAASEDQAQPAERRELLRRLAKMRSERDAVLVLTADFNKPEQVNIAVDAAIAHFGRVDVVVHGAARIDAAAFASIAETGPEVIDAQFSPKLRGFYHLADALKGREPIIWVLHSSISSVLGGLGLGVYAGANAVLDVLALKGGARWLSIDWDAWDNAAEAQSASMPTAIKAAEGQEAFLRLLGGWPCSRMLVVTNLAERLKAWVQHVDPVSERTTTVGVDRHARPNLVTPFVEPRTKTERRLAEIWGSQLGLVSVGIYDRFFDLGGHSLLAAQIAAEICDRFQIELPVLRLFQEPTIAELAAIVDKAQAGTDEGKAVGLPSLDGTAPVAATNLEGDATNVAAKASYREFYDDVSRRLAQSGVGESSFFLNYGYVSHGQGDEALSEVPANIFNPSSVRLAFELIGNTELKDLRVLDVGCGRGGTVNLMAEQFEAKACGVDLSPEAVAFCRKTHRSARFEVGDAEHLPFEDASFDVVTNIESSHTYPNLRAFFAEVSRVLAHGGKFLYTDLLPLQRWLEVRVLLESLGLKVLSDRDITPNVLSSCDLVAANRVGAFGEKSVLIENFLAIPGSAVYDQMHSGAWEYRLLRGQKAASSSRTRNPRGATGSRSVKRPRRLPSAE